MSINNLEGYNKRELIETIQIAQEEYQKLHKEHEALKLRAEKAEREIQGLEEKLTNFGLYVDDLRFLLSHHGDKIHRFGSGFGNVIMLIPALFVSLVAWIVAAIIVS